MTSSGRERNDSLVGKAFMESLEGLGETGKAVIVSNLQRRGVFIDDVQISLGTLRDVLVELLGEQATEIVMEHIAKSSDGHQNNTISADPLIW
jgi:microsomal dipeptidase-like Zn-dependent dipeptidase